MRALFVVLMFTLPGCHLLDDSYECPPEAEFPLLDVSGVWRGMIRDAFPVEYEIVQLSPALRPGDPYAEGEITGTVSITIGGGVEASGAVTGSTGPLYGCELHKVVGQSIGLDAELSVTPDDNTQLILTLGFLSTDMAPNVFDGLVDFAGPTSVTFGPDGKVVGFELDDFTDPFFTLTRAQRADWLRGPRPIVQVLAGDE